MATLDQIAKAIKRIGLDSNELIVRSVPAVATDLGEDLTGAFVTQVYEAEPVAFPNLKLAATQAGVKKGREQNLRFERISARTGLTNSEVRDLAEKAGVGADHYIGRGRKPGSNGSSTSTKTTKSGTSGRRGRASAKAEQPKSGTSGRRGRKTAAAEPAKGKTRGRRGTRASASPK
jgi:hypothetical protein